MYFSPVPVELVFIDVGAAMETEDKLDHIARIPTRLAPGWRSDRPRNEKSRESAKDGTTSAREGRWRSKAQMVL
jgi:hypothetical protein